MGIGSLYEFFIFDVFCPIFDPHLFLDVSLFFGGLDAVFVGFSVLGLFRSWFDYLVIWWLVWWFWWLLV